MAAELSYLWSSQLSEALDSFAQAARAFLVDYSAGKDPDPVPMLMRFGAANELLSQISERFEIGAEALGELRFSLARAAGAALSAGGEHDPLASSSNPTANPANPKVILLRPEEKRAASARGTE